MLWTHVTVALPQFDDRVSIEVPVPCTFDFNVAATKYFHGLSDGDVPLTFLFSGTAFYESGLERTLLVAPVPWDKEATFRLPVRTWHTLMDTLPQRGVVAPAPRHFERLAEFKRRYGIPTFEETLERLLPADVPAVQS